MKNRAAERHIQGHTVRYYIKKSNPVYKLRIKTLNVHERVEQLHKITLFTIVNDLIISPTFFKTWSFVTPCATGLECVDMLVSNPAPYTAVKANRGNFRWNVFAVLAIVESKSTNSL